jgi:hypothetical protein
LLWQVVKPDDNLFVVTVAGAGSVVAGQPVARSRMACVFQTS